MRPLLFIIFVVFAATAAFSQPAPDILATSTGHTYRKSDLSVETRAALDGMPATVAKARTQLLAQLTNDKLIETEAKTRGVSPQKLVDEIEAKAPAPTEAEINAVYQANLAALDNKPLVAVRKPIVDFLKRDAGQKALQAFVESLRTKHKVIMLKDINAADLRPAVVIFSVNGVPTQAQEFEDKYRVTLFDLAADISDQVLADLDNIIYSTVVIDEAKALNIDSSAFLASEITDKLKDYSPEERVTLEDGLRKKLYTKYQVKVLYKAPEPFIEQISVDDDPAQGPIDAPVTIVMFSDFQCSACAATHPLVKKAISEYQGKVRFVVRDFPLENLHENAFNAALAANAAKDGGKFFEYIEILYQNQAALDTASLKRYAANIGLQAAQFELSFNSEKTVSEVRKDMADGDRYGISSTPTVFVNGVRVRKLSLAGFREAIDRSLRK